MLNIAACLLFEHLHILPVEDLIVLSSGEMKFRPSWFTSELNELFGILVIDISMMDIESYKVLACEVGGLVILIFAAAIDYYILPYRFYPFFKVRQDLLTIAESVGLVMLIMVAVAHHQKRNQDKAKKKFEHQSSHLV